MIRLGVNIDHVATVRQARRAGEPDPVAAAILAELGGADGITVHLRGDRRHIQESDVRRLRETVQGTLNLEMALGEDVLDLALAVLPDQVCLVPEHRQELTTEGGLVLTGRNDLSGAITRLRDAGILVSLFIEPDPETVSRARDLGAHAVELHTGSWSRAWAGARGALGQEALTLERRRLDAAAARCTSSSLRIHAGHGLTYGNIADLVGLPGLLEVNIGHSIVSRAVLIGMEAAVRQMRLLLATPGLPDIG